MANAGRSAQRFMYAAIAGERDQELFYTKILPAQEAVESVVVFVHGFVR